MSVGKEEFIVALRQPLAIRLRRVPNARVHLAGGTIPKLGPVRNGGSR